MNDRQRDLFLWIWSRRRKPGRAAVALRGALVGALGGAVFAGVMFSAVGKGGNHSFAAVLASLKDAGMLFLLSIPAFGAMGFAMAYRVFSSQEAMYQSLLRSGARVPEQKPVLSVADRWPAIMVGVVVVVIVAFIVFLFIKFGRHPGIPNG